MLYSVDIYNPFTDHYGGKISFRLPQKIEEIKAFTLNVVDQEGVESAVAGLPVEIFFDLFKFSLILNNGNDEVITDAPYQYSLYRNIGDWGGAPDFTIELAYHKQKVFLNKKIIKNSVHQVIFKMTDDLLTYGALGAGMLAFVNWLRTPGNFQLKLFIEAA